MLNLNSEQLFLLEVVVDQICVENVEDADGGILHTEFKFNGLPCFEVARGSGVGKSCLFCIEPLTLANTMQREPIVLSVWWKPNKNLIPNIIAQSTIHFPESMVQLALSGNVRPEPYPIEEKFQGFFDLFDRNGVHVGEVNLIVRLTCYGRNILTKLKLVPGSKFRFENSVPEGVCEACTELPKEPTLTENAQELQVEMVDTSCDTADLPIQEHKTTEKNELMKVDEVVVKEVKKKKGNKKGPIVTYPGIMMGHRTCVGQGFGVSRRHGWAWKTELPLGTKPRLMEGWRPGCFARVYKNSLIRPPFVMPQPSERYLKIPKKPKKTNKVPTINIVRKNGEYRVKVHPPDAKEPLEYTHPADPNDSDMEIEFDLPEPYLKRPAYRHQAQQFCEEDLPLKPSLQIHPPFQKKKKKTADKGKKGKKGKVKGKRDKEKKVTKKDKRKAEDDKIQITTYPWDDWVLKLKCDDDLNKLVWRPKKKKEPKKGKERPGADDDAAAAAAAADGNKKPRRKRMNDEKVSSSKKKLKKKKVPPKKKVKKENKEKPEDVRDEKGRRKGNPNARLPFYTLKKLPPPDIPCPHEKVVTYTCHEIDECQCEPDHNMTASSNCQQFLTSCCT